METAIDCRVQLFPVGRASGPRWKGIEEFKNSDCHKKGVNHGCDVLVKRGFILGRLIYVALIVSGLGKRYYDVSAILKARQLRRIPFITPEANVPDLPIFDPNPRSTIFLGLNGLD